MLELRTLVLLPPSLRPRQLSEPDRKEPELLAQLVEVPVIERGIDHKLSVVRGSIRLIRSESCKNEALPVGPK